jgi:release factor glutamine methyltransferase
MSRLTGAQALAGARSAGIDRLDAQLLLLHALGKPASDRAWLMAHDTDPLIAAVSAHFAALTQRRAAGEPLAYLVGRQEFFALDLQVDPRVLIPRPDTETLVNWSLELLKMTGMPAEPAVLDLGTGSGAIALAIAHSLKKAGQAARVVAVDASADALVVARENATRLRLDVTLIESSWLEQVSGRFHLIVSNPPYIADADRHLEALRYEPLTALTAGPDGLEDLRKIIGEAPSHLDPGGWLLLEHGFDQAAAVRGLLTAQGFESVQSRLDLAGIERCSGGCRPF